MLSRHESDHIWVLCYGKCVCLYLLPLWAQLLTDRWSTRKEKVLLTRGAEGGSQCWRAWGQATLRMRSGGRWRRGGRGGGWRGRRGGGASSRQGGRRGGQPLSRLHICQTQSNQQGYNSKAHPSVHLQTHMLKHTHARTHTNEYCHTYTACSSKCMCTHTSPDTFAFTSHFPWTIFLFSHAHWLPCHHWFYKR